MSTNREQASLSQRLKCRFGFHSLVVSQEEQRLLEEVMSHALARVFKLDTLSDGTKVMFKKCKYCGAKR